MDEKLEAILAKKLEEVIDVFRKEFSQFGMIESPLLVKEASVHKVKLRDQLICLEPNIYEAREYCTANFTTI